MNNIIRFLALEGRGGEEGRGTEKKKRTRSAAHYIAVFNVHLCCVLVARLLSRGGEGLQSLLFMQHHKHMDRLLFQTSNKFGLVKKGGIFDIL